MSARIPCPDCRDGRYTFDNPNDPCARICRCETCDGDNMARCCECADLAVDIFEEQDLNGVVYAFPLCAKHLQMFNEDAIENQVRELTC